MAQRNKTIIVPKSSDNKCVERFLQIYPYETVNFLARISKINKRNVVQPRLLIIGKFNICTLKLAVLKMPKVKRTSSLLDIEGIEAGLPNDEIKIGFKTFTIHLSSPIRSQIASKILEGIATLLDNEPLHERIRMSLPENFSWSPLSMTRLSPQESFLNRFQALYLQKTGRLPAKELQEWIGQTFNSESKALHLPFHLDRQHYSAIFESLQRDTFFEELCISNCTRVDALDQLSDTLSCNTQLKRLMLRKISAVQLSAFDNISHELHLRSSVLSAQKLQSLVFVGCRFSPIICRNLSEAFKRPNGGLRIKELVVIDAAIPPTDFVLLLESLCSGSSSQTISDLNFSRQSRLLSNTQVVASVSQAIQSLTFLSHLTLSYCDLNPTEAFLDTLEHLSSKRCLQNIDLSGNSFDPNLITPRLFSIFKKRLSLQTARSPESFHRVDNAERKILALSNCNLGPDQVDNIFSMFQSDDPQSESLSSRTSICVDLDLSRNFCNNHPSSLSSKTSPRQEQFSRSFKAIFNPSQTPPLSSSSNESNSSSSSSSSSEGTENGTENETETQNSSSGSSTPTSLLRGPSFVLRTLLLDDCYLGDIGMQTLFEIVEKGQPHLRHLSCSRNLPSISRSDEPGLQVRQQTAKIFGKMLASPHNNLRSLVMQGGNLRSTASPSLRPYPFSKLHNLSQSSREHILASTFSARFPASHIPSTGEELVDDEEGEIGQLVYQEEMVKLLGAMGNAKELLGEIGDDQIPEGSQDLEVEIADHMMAFGTFLGDELTNLTHNQSLVFLDLSCNDIQEASVSPLLDVFKKNKTLLSLNINDNGISGFSTILLFQGLKQLTSRPEFSPRLVHCSCLNFASSFTPEELSLNQSFSSIWSDRVSSTAHVHLVTLQNTIRNVLCAHPEAMDMMNIFEEILAIVKQRKSFNEQPENTLNLILNVVERAGYPLIQCLGENFVSDLQRFCFETSYIRNVIHRRLSLLSSDDPPFLSETP